MAASTCVVSLAANAAVTASFGPATTTTPTTTTAATTPAIAVVPQLVGLRLATAITRLARSRFRLGTVTKQRVRAALVGKVLAQRPDAGEYVDPGRRVALVVGKR